MKAEIITIGNELLIGQVIDTNSAYIAQELNRIGISVWQITSVSDNRQHILDALQEASQRVSLILITGGLGPTKDDVTKKALAEYTGDHLVSNPEILRDIEEMMAVRSISMNPLNVKQAEVLEHATVIRNSCGTAPGMWFQKDQVFYISMPGVPFEMKAMMQNEILPRLQQLFGGHFIQHKTLLVTGVPESVLALMIEKWEDNLPPSLSLAYLPSSGIIRLRLTGNGIDKNEIDRQINQAVDTLRPLLGLHLLSENDENP